ncbi:MAG: aldehyde dehydrogenase [Lachnospiraceae bacterium]|nr:aldehyde dehydrogenase [Lachnospiraceae bacterium]
MNMNFNEVLKMKEKAELKTQAFINGEYTDAIDKKTFDNISPIDGKLIARIASCSEKDAEKAVKSARQAFNKGIWSQMLPEQRKSIMYNFASLIENHLFELALMETIDMGKPISDALGEIKRCAKGIRWFAEASDKVYGKVAMTRSNVSAQIIKEPYGVVAAIIPWNYPLMMAVWKFAPALATGNSVILKPAEQSPLSLIRLADLALSAGIPAGIFQVLPGYGETVGKALACHLGVDKIAFTGSTEVGKLILQYSGLSNMKAVSLECGGKCANIVFADAQNLDHVAQQAAGAIFYNSGQVCDAPTRLLIEKPIYNEFIEKVKHYSQDYAPLNPLNPSSKMGSMVSEEQMSNVLEYISIGLAEGAKLVMGGKQVNEDTGGFYIEPTIFADVKNNMRIAQEEIFGPVLSILKFETLAEAIEIANDSIYGLCTFAWTSDLNKAREISKNVRCGKILINSTSDGEWSVPHGGFKQSGFGRDKSLESMDQYVQTKLIWTEY